MCGIFKFIRHYKAKYSQSEEYATNKKEKLQTSAIGLRAAATERESISSKVRTGIPSGKTKHK